ncbi:MAG TPA: HTTM domain-containing protein [Polyangiaceae bacterium]
MTRTSVDRAVRYLLAPVDAAWLVAFRVLFGLTFAFSMQRFLANGWVERFFVTPGFHFKYWGFEWVEPLPNPYMAWLFVALGVLALAIAAGAAFRFSAFAFAVGFSYVQLIDVSTYLNHYYLAALLAFLLALSPAHRSFSVDAWLSKRFGRPAPATAPPERPAVARAWLFLFRFQIGVVYTFAGLAKAQSDWLIHAQPLRIWLGTVTDLPLLGPLVTLPVVPLLFAWSGFLFDTTIVAFLLWNRTRPFAYAVVIVFHVLTRVLFPIGMFPVIMVLSALVFFPPEWPRRLLARARSRLGARRTRTATLPPPSPAAPAFGPLGPPSRWALGALAFGAVYCALHLALPLRYLAYGGNVLWHEQGMRFSWRVMLRAKGGSTTFLVKSPEQGRRFYVEPRDYLTRMQEYEMSSQPDLIVQLAHHIRDDYSRRGFGSVEVYANSRVSLNGRRSVPFLDPSVDLARIPERLDLRDLVLPPPTETPPHTRPVL